MSNRRTNALRFQAAYYIATGAAPLLSRRAFEAVTGPKRDWWLVQMVGMLAVGNGIALAAGSASAARGRDPSRETIALSLCSALAFATIDTVYALKGRIAPVYLADAALEMLIAAAVIPP